ncbi:hypothetical protein BJ980_001092 [Nocardioides daedukensis]|uniref:PH domain-containing protein n=1 Tax=Nocardioides daedukensis TaxID=634462 RepID=A0A7Y9UTG7_9ACTN|nr:hypothetical protein [Nocardioides daedukensis]NYG58169.1 hypothetical protein [Nocardioides daedukensis]
MTPGPDGTVELERTHFFDTAALVCGAVMLLPTLSFAPKVIADPRPGAVAVLVVMAVVLVALPIWIGLIIRSLRFYVGPQAITALRGGKVWREVRLDEMTRVVPGETVATGIAKRFTTLQVFGEHQGRRVGVALNRQLVSDLAPAVAVLAPHVRARPGLLPDTDDARGLWQRLLDGRDV